MFACLFQPPPTEGPGADRASATLLAVARAFSPRYEQHRENLVSVDVSGLGRLFGDARAIGAALQRDLTAHGVRAHVALAARRTAALVLAQARPGLTVIAPGQEASALAPLPIEFLETVEKTSAIARLKTWGLHTLGDLAALPPADLAGRLGPRGLLWQAVARGDDRRPLVPTLPEERFESSLELEWPIEGLEPLSFVLTRLLEPLSARLERCDRGAAVLYVTLDLVTGERHPRRLQLPSPLRDARTLRTLALLDLESHPPPAAIDRITIVIDPTPGRILQHTLFARALPTPERLSTLLARLIAVMGQDRIGAPALVDTDRPGAFTMKSFATEFSTPSPPPSAMLSSMPKAAPSPMPNAVPNAVCPTISAPASFARVEPRAESSAPRLRSALRRCRQPVPARVAVEHGEPVRVTTDRRGFAGGRVLVCAGPWRTSGAWWEGPLGRARGSAHQTSWNRDEWEVALSDGAVYRIFQDREADGWFIDAIVD